MDKTIKWYTLDQVLDIVFTGADGKRILSKTTLLKMCNNGTIKAHRLGLQRKIFISAEELERLLSLS